MTPVFFGEQVGQPQQEALQHGSPDESVDYFFHGTNVTGFKDNLLVEKTQTGKKSIKVGKDDPILRPDCNQDTICSENLFNTANWYCQLPTEEKLRRAVRSFENWNGFFGRNGYRLLEL